MPGSPEMGLIRGVLERDSLRALMADDGLMESFGAHGGLLETIDKVLPDLDPSERAWFAAVPIRLMEAIRGVILSVANSDEELHLDVQFEPAYDFAVTVYEFDRHVVVRVSGPYPGQTYPHQEYRSR